MSAMHAPPRTKRAGHTGTARLTLLERRELEAGVLDEAHELLVRRRFAELAVRLCRIELSMA